MSNKLYSKKLTKKLLKRSNRYRISALDEIQKPQIAWGMVNNETNYLTILGTLGNFSLITGKAKSRKSFFMSLITSTAVLPYTTIGQFQSKLPEGKRKVLFFDTEQGKYHAQLVLKGICRLSNTDNPENLSFYGLRSLPPDKRLKLIEFVLYSNDDVGFVVIDGIKDLITSINSEEEATAISSKLLKWTEERNIHIVCVLHQNKGDANARGHIGSELTHKAETVLSVTKAKQNKDISIVEAVFCRNKDPDSFAFEIIDGLPVEVEDFEIQTSIKKKRKGLLELANNEKFQLLNEVFSKNEEYMRGKLVEALKKVIEERKPQFPSGDTAMRKYINHFKENKWLIQEAQYKPYRLGRYEN